MTPPIPPHPTEAAICQCPPEVQAYLDACTPPDRDALILLRRLILQRAAELPRIGRLTEALRWGQPAYNTPDTRAACSLRIGTFPKGGIALFVHCRTDLIERFRATIGAGLPIQGTRAVRFATANDIPAAPLLILIGWALTYHLPRPRCGLTFTPLDDPPLLAEEPQ